MKTETQVGMVKKWDEVRGFGFIDRPGDSDIFVHASGVIGRRVLEVGQQVEYELREGTKGPKAINVRVVR